MPGAHQYLLPSVLALLAPGPLSASWKAADPEVEAEAPTGASPACWLQSIGWTAR